MRTYTLTSQYLRSIRVKAPSRWLTRSGDKKKDTLEIAIYHFSSKIVSRSSGRSSVAAAAYRAGCELTDLRTGTKHDYSNKSDVVHSEIMAPKDAPDWAYDRGELWNTVEISENRKDAQTAREIEVALPVELTLEAQRDLVRDFVSTQFVSKGMVADIAIHNPHKVDQQENPHAHILLTTREITPDGFSPTKNREWNTKEQLVDWRKEWAEMHNAALKKNGHEVTVDHRSLKAQNLAAIVRGDQKAAEETDRQPTSKMGQRVTAMERRGVKTDRGNTNRGIRLINRVHARRPKPISSMFEKHLKRYALMTALGVNVEAQIIVAQQEKFIRALLPITKAKETAATVPKHGGQRVHKPAGPRADDKIASRESQKKPTSLEILRQAGEKMAAREPVQLHVPFSEKEKAKKAGAKWNRETKQWYAPDKNKLDGLERWAKERHEPSSEKEEVKKPSPLDVLRQAGERMAVREPMQLHVPFSEKEEAKKAGAKWNRKTKQWYAPDKNKLGGLKRWTKERKQDQDQDRGRKRKSDRGLGLEL